MGNLFLLRALITISSKLEERTNTWYDRKDSQQNQTLGKKGKIWEMQRKQLRNLKENIDRIQRK